MNSRKPYTTPKTKNEKISPNELKKETAELVPKRKVIICDTNVVVLMVLFKKSIMFDAPYDCGKIVVHKSVEEELRRWVGENSRKRRRFGALVDDFHEMAKKHLSDALAEPQNIESQIEYLAVLESKLPKIANDTSMPTTTTDRTLLVVANENQAKLATQERRLTRLSEVFSNGVVISFVSLVVELLQRRLLNSDDIQSGLDTLDSYREELNHKDRAILESHLPKL